MFTETSLVRRKLRQECIAQWVFLGMSASMVVPLYIGEIGPPRIRGALVSFNQLAITSGILASYLVDYGLASTQNCG